jgi:hypothetical protein
MSDETKELLHQADSALEFFINRVSKALKENHKRDEVFIELMKLKSVKNTGLNFDEITEIFR